MHGTHGCHALDSLDGMAAPWHAYASPCHPGPVQIGERHMKPLSQWEQLAIEASLFRTLKRWEADTSLGHQPPGVANLIALIAKLDAGRLYVAKHGSNANVQ